MFDVAIPLVVELVLSASYILPPSSSPASFCLGLPLDLFPSIFPSITIFNSDSPLRVCPIHFFCLVFIVRMREISSPIVSNISSFVFMFCPADFLHSSPSPHIKSPKSFYIFFPHCPCFCSIQHHTQWRS